MLQSITLGSLFVALAGTQAVPALGRYLSGGAYIGLGVYAATIASTPRTSTGLCHCAPFPSMIRRLPSWRTSIVAPSSWNAAPRA